VILFQISKDSSIIPMIKKIFFNKTKVFYMPYSSLHGLDLHRLWS